MRAKGKKTESDRARLSRDTLLHEVKGLIKRPEMENIKKV